jgi:prolyl-tRNA synthetase
MRMSRLFSQTQREAPSGVETASHQLLWRAGFVRQLAAGVFSNLPLARRSLSKIEAIIRREIEAIGGQEITMPVVHPGDLWKETNRWYEIDVTMTRFQDRNGRDMLLGMTHEEVVTDLARKEIRSYRQLPVLVYQIQTKWRDEPRARGGLIRVREFTMKDSYSLDLDETGLDEQYRAHYQAYFNIYHACGLPVIAVASDTGMMGGKAAHEFMYLTPIGEDTLLLCDTCDFQANREVAHFAKPAAPAEETRPVEKVATPDAKTIEALAEFLNIPKARTAKAVFMVATLTEGQADVEKFVFAVIRGDMDINDIKLSNAIKAKSLRPAEEAEIRAIGAEPGFGSPVGVHDCLIVVDDAIPESPNLVAGANEAGYHLLNVNYGRDYTAHVVADIAAAQEGDACPVCGGTLRAVRGVEVGNIFKLGTRYSAIMGATYLDQNGEARPIVMGSYGIGVGRLLACVAEEHHDDDGLIWPVSVAPYHVHIVSLGKPGSDTESVADRLYADLQAAGVEVLYDDRAESPGVKFTDADLIGLPLRLTVGDRGLKEGVVELKYRATREMVKVPVGQIVDCVRSEIARLQAEIDAGVVPVAYRE